MADSGKIVIVQFRFFRPSRERMGLDSGPNAMTRIIRNLQDNMGSILLCARLLNFSTFYHVFGHFCRGIVGENAKRTEIGAALALRGLPAL
jgi:hypothetical protein